MAENIPNQDELIKSLTSVADILVGSELKDISGSVDALQKELAGSIEELKNEISERQRTLQEEMAAQVEEIPVKIEQGKIEQDAIIEETKDALEKSLSDLDSRVKSVEKQAKTDIETLKKTFEKVLSNQIFAVKKTIDGLQKTVAEQEKTLVSFSKEQERISDFLNSFSRVFGQQSKNMTDTGIIKAVGAASPPPGKPSPKGEEEEVDSDILDWVKKTKKVNTVE